MLRSLTLAVAAVVLAACSVAAPSPAPTAAPTATTAPTSAPTAAPTSGPTSTATAVVTAAPTLGGTPAASATTPPSGGPAAELCGEDWFTSAGECSSEVGARFLFTCPPAGRDLPIWGTDTYTSDSSVCTAAVHVGLITIASGGNATIEIRPGLDAYVGSTRNGITSRDYANWGSSFVFVDGAVAGPTEPPSDPLGTPSPELAPLLAHVPAAFNVNCHEVTTFSAGEVIAAQCTPDIVTGYVTYTLFDTDGNTADAWFGNLDYFGVGVTGTDCSAGPCLVGYVGTTGLVEGRYFSNNYTGIDPTGLIAYWFDGGEMIQAGLVVYETTFAELYDLALQAGPLP